MSARTVAFLGPVGVGKTALVQRVAGIDDALVGEAEHRTGRTLAPHEVVRDGVGLVDLPGTLSGVVVAALAAADAHVLCVAVDEGLSVELREHAAVLTALGRTAAVVCGTRADRAPAELQAAADLPCVDPRTTAIVVTSAADDVGTSGLLAAARRTPRRSASGPAVLHVEGVQDVPGAGTAITGGLLRGALRVGDALQVLPAWRDAVVGALRVRGELVAEAVAGDRVVLRLDGIAADAVAPGDALVAPDAGVVRSAVMDVSFDEQVRLEHGATVTVLAGAREVRAEVGWLGGRFHQLRVADDAELLVAPWDRIVVRTDAGEVEGADVLDPAARRHGPSREVLAELARLARERAG